MTMVPEFTDGEIDIIRALLIQRYQKDVEIQLGDSEILLSPEDGAAATCPTVFWFEQGANFVVAKLAESKFRAQFFYTPREQFDTRIDRYNDLNLCVSTVLQTQSDHERELSSTNSIDSTKTMT